jgi:hypothetical protein
VVEMRLGGLSRRRHYSKASLGSQDRAFDCQTLSFRGTEV